MAVVLKKSPQTPQNQMVAVPEEDEILSITIGSAQIGGSFVEDQNGNLIVKGIVTNFNLGKGSSLIGKKIKIFTNVLDVNNFNDDVIVTHRFTNEKKSFRYQETAPANGVVSIEVEYTFI
jgi:hypothetical protein